MRLRYLAVGLVSLIALAAVQPVNADKRLFTDAFTPQEFTARRQGVMNAIGDGVAIISGAYDTATYTKFRQNAQFFYLTGVEVPRALLLIDGRTKTSTLFLPPHGSLERSEGPLLGPDDEAKKLTGIEQVVDRAAFEKALQALAGSGRALYMPFRAESLGAGTPDRVRSRVAQGATVDDLRALARDEGLVTLREAAWHAAANGVTSIAEVLRVTSEDDR